MRVFVIAANCLLVAACAGAGSSPPPHEPTPASSSAAPFPEPPRCKIAVGNGDRPRYPLRLRVLPQGELNAIEARFRKETGIQWSSVFMSPFGTVAAASVAERSGMPPETLALLPRPGNDPASVHKAWVTFLGDHRAMFGVPTFSDASCAPSATFEIAGELGSPAGASWAPPGWGQVPSAVVSGFVIPPRLPDTSAGPTDATLSAPFVGTKATVVLKRDAMRRTPCDCAAKDCSACAQVSRDDDARERELVKAMPTAERRTPIVLDAARIQWTRTYMFFRDGDAVELRRVATPQLTPLAGEFPEALRGFAELSIDAGDIALTMLDAVTGENLRTRCATKMATVLVPDVPIGTCLK